MFNFRWLISQDKERLDAFRQLGMLSSLGFMFALSIFLGLGVGYYLDQKCNTAPYLTMTGMVLGIVAAFVSLYREIRRLLEREEDETGDGDKRSES
ncbi:AtpZ/AtpI family protein [bacterium]|nr:AtpZ/AtpI family protein [bacterium]